MAKRSVSGRMPYVCEPTPGLLADPPVIVFVSREVAWRTWLAPLEYSP
ncbi:MAG TPA: hypothetical protein VH352_26430 [Pseudonocardiaceae bacterium]|nr:hypothetical protein [Pseudonocardiaceae bacterium]